MKFNVNNSISPGNDFDLFVNSLWLNNNKIPSDYNRWGSFEILMEDTNNRLKEILVNSDTINDDHHKIKNLYKSGMNINNLNILNYHPIVPFLEKINKINNLNGITSFISLMIMCQLSTPFYLSVHADAKNSSQNVIYLYQGGLGLPDRDYYLLENKEKERMGYKQYLKQLYLLTGLNDLSIEIFCLEEKLANVSQTRTERRELELVYNVYDIHTLTKLCPNINWELFFSKLGVDPKKIIVDNPKFFQELNTILENYDIEIIKHYLKSNLIRSTAPYLSEDFYNSYFNFYLKQLKGQEEPKPRWKRTLSTVESLMGEVLGKIYVEKYFPQSTKEKALDMVNNIKNELGETIKCLDWMSSETKVKALAKLDNFKVKIGYPDKWRNYSKLEIDENCFLNNIINTSIFDMKYDLSKAYTKVDKDKWEMNAHQINAYYHPLLNEIVFPAGILQSPFFDYNADDAVNYGGIGAVIGHEMTHGFDDKGKKFDLEGNLNDWWTEEDTIRYTAKAKILSEQFSKYEIEGEKVNGELTLGENIADLGGITIAYSALMKKIGDSCIPEIDGFTQEQRFFLSWANVWKANIRKETALERLITDPHSPACLRINGVVTNLKEFYDAFNVSKEDKLYKDENEMAKIW
jgi:putative endopeptidase